MIDLMKISDQQFDLWVAAQGQIYLFNLPLEARQSNTLNSFKLFLIKDILPIPRYYYHGNRKPQILHSRLRTGCSALNLDLFTKNITDSPLCSCGSIENSQHYFFDCRNYEAIRHELLNSISLIQNPSFHLLLYGDPALPEESNRSIFDHVHNYILKSRRFWCDIYMFDLQMPNSHPNDPVFPH